MKRIQLLSIAILTLLLFNSCGSLKAPAIHQFSSIELTSSTGVAYAVGNGLYGNTSKTINPSDVISGIFLKNGFIRLPELKPDLLDQTIVVNYGESGRRNKGLGYTIEVTIQILSAKTSEPICICTAEGQGETEADDVRIAINRALSPLFGN